MLAPDQIIAFDDAPPPPGESPWLPGHGPTREVIVVAPDPAWPAVFERIAGLIRGALGEAALELEHVGSTSVPDLEAKPIIDIDLTVPDSADERAYVPALEQSGFQLFVREPWWYEHRCLRLSDPACNLHVFSPDCPEAARHRIFRDWLRTHPDDRRLYAGAKRAAAQETVRSAGSAEDYNARKEAMIREIYARAFQALGLVH